MTVYALNVTVYAPNVTVYALTVTVYPLTVTVYPLTVIVYPLNVAVRCEAHLAAVCLDLERLVRARGRPVPQGGRRQRALPVAASVAASVATSVVVAVAVCVAVARLDLEGALRGGLSENSARLAQTMHVGPCILVGTQL